MCEPNFGNSVISQSWQMDVRAVVHGLEFLSCIIWPLANVYESTSSGNMHCATVLTV